MRIAVCDDDRIFLEEITDLLRELSEAEELYAYSELKAFLHSVDSGERYHVVFMDIDWHEKAEGMSTAEYLYRRCPETKIIYVTGYNDRFSQDIFLHRSNLSGYLTKPVDPVRLRANLKKVADQLTEIRASLVFRSEGAYVSVAAEQILYIESIAHKIVVHTEEGTFTNYERLDQTAEKLPGCFFQCHKSYLVNLNRIQRLQPDSVILKNGASVPVSRSRYRQTREAYLKYMGQSF